MNEIKNESEQKENKACCSDFLHPHKKLIVTVVLISFLLSSFCGAVFGFMAAGIGQGKIFSKITGQKNGEQGQNTTNGSSRTTSVPDEGSAVIKAVDKASPSVVSIIISKDVARMQNFFSDPFFDPFGSGNNNQNNQGGTEKQEIGGGSGFIVSGDGLIATNKHVVSDQSASYTVMTNDGKKYDAKVLAIDPVNDVAILKIDAANLPVLELGDSANLKIGQTVIAIGNSLGEFRNTVSKGIISGLKRNVMAGSGLGDSENLSEVIQTDAAINPGNSGGPLLDINGKVIGVNVAMAQGAQNVGFALPIDIIKKDIDSVKTQGKIVQPYIGVRYMPVTANLAKQNNLPYEYGALVLRGQKITDFAVVPGSPADKAGIVENDIILEINEIKIDENHQFIDQIAKFSVGDTVTLKIWHKGEEKTAQVKLEERK
ncbi:MAG: trypsin-like peptidase domain-containing protein [Candidatus Moranbacteria bacterium]|nr:trypsin-like peptidase domain-containing protein [Candidatus Moranbacteria bacterium]